MQYIFSKFDEPVKIFSVGHFFVWEKQPGKKFMYRIDNVDLLIYDYSGQLQGGQKISDVDISTLQPTEGVMYTFFVGVLGPIKVYLKQPTVIARWGVGGYPGYVTQETSPIYAPNPATFTVVLKDTKFTISIENPTQNTVNYTIRFYGYKYAIEEVSELLEVTDEGVIRFKKSPMVKIPSSVIEEKWRAYIRGALPELITQGISR